ncbi:MAG: hypothetical protein N2V75_00470 [Methanophagales archaeon]|nr:hypothetical protein [Methanophagales archaeon]
MMETKRKRGRRSSGVELSRFSVSLPLRLLQVFESVIKEQGYATISEAIRDLMRLHVERALAREKEGQELGIVAYILPANANERKLTLINEMMECEAEFRDVVQSISMVMAGSKIMRVAIVCGYVKRINEFKDAVEALKDVNVIGTAGWKIDEL